MHESRRGAGAGRRRAGPGWPACGALAVVTLGWLAACGGSAEAPGGADGPPDVGPSAPERVESTALTALDSASLAAVRGAADALGAGLMGALLAQLEAGGPLAALSFCSDSAQAITARYQSAGLQVHRTSLKVRNPRNTPDSVEVRVLDQLAAWEAAGALPAEYVELRRLGTGAREVRYFRPLRVQPGCLACHGAVDGITPAIQAVLAERYPDDAAVGYAAGDLRGVIAVRRPVPAP
jgi:hypothetical protein